MRTKTKFLVPLACMALLACKSQAEQRETTTATASDKVFAVGDFDEIEIKCNADVTVEFVQGNNCEVTAQADADVLDDIKMTVKNGELNVKYGSFLSSNSHKIHLTIKAPTLREFSANGSTEFNCKKLEQWQDFSADLGGTSSVKIEALKCGKLEADVDGNSTFSVDKAACHEADFDANGSSAIKGNCVADRSMECDISGCSDISLSGKAMEIDLDVSGASKADCNVVCDRLEIELSGSASAVLKGEAGSVRKTVKGSASLNDRDLKPAVRNY